MEWSTICGVSSSSSLIHDIIPGAPFRAQPSLTNPTAKPCGIGMGCPRTIPYSQEASETVTAPTYRTGCASQSRPMGCCSCSTGGT